MPGTGKKKVGYRKRKKEAKVRHSFHPRVDSIYQEQIKRREKESWIMEKKERDQASTLLPSKSGFNLPGKRKKVI